MNRIILFLFLIKTGVATSQPWKSPLKWATSTDGITFTSPAVFQDSAGVPSVIHWKSDTLVCVFQWFREPMGSATWDKVAVKFSFDKGETWTSPVPIVISGFPSGYQRPFDPTLVVLPDKKLRIYYSSSNGMPPGGLSEIVDTHSAISEDGINYTYEADPRVNEASKQVIDPAVVWFNSSWHYAAPKGAPADGAYHYVSPDGLNFSKVADIPSDAMHNWTGNYCVVSSTEVRFYGCGGSKLWYNSSPNGGTWNGYINTNLGGGDPSVVKIPGANYLMVFVGEPYATGISEEQKKYEIRYFQGEDGETYIENHTEEKGIIRVFDLTGTELFSAYLELGQTCISFPAKMARGLYPAIFTGDSGRTCVNKIIK